MKATLDFCRNNGRVRQMWRFLGGVASALLMVAAGIFIWRSQADAGQIARPPAALSLAAAEAVPLGDPPQASEKTREEKRFGRFDRDKNGGVAAEEFLLSRRKAYARIDADGNGTLSFAEYAGKAVIKFKAADADRSGVLTPAEFLTTRVVRKTKPGATNCPPPAKATPADGDDAET